MDILREVEEETIDHSLGIPISNDVLLKKLNTAEESQRRLREHYLSLVSRLKEKDQVIDLVRSEASMNAQALMKFVQENQKLASGCEDLVNQCKNWERECFIYHQDREKLMVYERAREVESRVQELEEQVREMKSRTDFEKSTSLEEDVLLESVNKDETLLERNIHDQYSRTLLSKWDQLKPSTQKTMSLVSIVKEFEKEKECLILNLAKAEEEVELVSIQNRELVRENHNLLKQPISPLDSAAERSKSNKRKGPELMNSPIEKRLELSSIKSIDASKS